jgi:hypothetical protein
VVPADQPDQTLHLASDVTPAGSANPIGELSAELNELQQAYHFLHAIHILREIVGRP